MESEAPGTYLRPRGEQKVRWFRGLVHRSATSSAGKAAPLPAQGGVVEPETIGEKADGRPEQSRRGRCLARLFYVLGLGTARPARVPVVGEKPAPSADWQPGHEGHVFLEHAPLLALGPLGVWSRWSLVIQAAAPQELSLGPQVEEPVRPPAPVRDGD